MKKPTVTVAIPAYNEENNIIRLLSSVYRQKHNNFALEKVIVYSDGSTDGTVELVCQNFEKAEVVDSKKRLGKIKRINQIMKENYSDVLIQIDADVRLSDDRVFEKLVTPIIGKNEVGISCSYHRASKPEYFIEKLAYFGFKVWDRARNSLGKKGIRYYCEGGLRAFPKKFTNEFRIPALRGISEDGYSFYWAIANGYKVAASKDAIVYIDLPTNYHDYAKQMKRFLSNPNSLAILFDKNTLKKYQLITREVKLRALWHEMLRDPLAGIGYICLQLAIYIEKLFYKPDLNWSSIKRR
jgi:glycosyltransferase involved in cell wall biosynthesis